MDFLLNPLIVGPACLIVGALIGVGLSRRSKTANAAYDRAVAELEELRAKYNALRDKK